MTFCNYICRLQWSSLVGSESTECDRDGTQVNIAYKDGAEVSITFKYGTQVSVAFKDGSQVNISHSKMVLR